MRIYILTLLLFGITINCDDKTTTDGGYIITGQLFKYKGFDRVVLSYAPDNEWGSYTADTTEIVDGKFRFEGIMKRPRYAQLDLVKKAETDEYEIIDEGEWFTREKAACFYLDGNIDVKFDDQGVVSYSGGGKEQQAWLEWQGMSKELEASHDGVTSMEDIQNLTGKFVARYPDRYVSVDLMDVVTQDPIQYDLVAPMYDDLSERMKNSAKVLVWKSALDEAKAYLIGELKAPLFTMNDLEGNPIALESYSGKYVLLDFWASWCAPCRAENPNLLMAYKNYKNSNFDILAVSIDTDKEAWIKAVYEDQLPWKHISDLKGGDNEAAKAYGVGAIPDNFLINPEGYIVGRGLRGKALHDKLNNLMTKKTK